MPGPVERILHDLGVTSTDVLHRASAIDQAGEQLILDAAQATNPGHPAFRTASLSRSVGTAEIINHLLASGNPDAAALLHPSPPPVVHHSGHPAKDERRQPDRPAARQTPEPEAEP